MRAVFRGGKLTKEAGWRNVAEHCFASAVAADIFAEALGLSADEGRRLVSTSAVSDWSKRLEKRPEEFTDDDRESAENLITRVHPDRDLLEVTGPEFFVRSFENYEGIPFLHNLMCYIDDITDQGTWTSFRERIPKVIRPDRWGDLNARYSPRLGGKGFVEYAIEHEARFQEELYARLVASLSAKGREAPSSPDDIPAWLSRELDRRVKEHTSGAV